MSLCPKCGATLRPSIRFCHICGHQLNASVKPGLPAHQGFQPNVLMASQVNAPSTAVALITNNGQIIPLSGRVTIGRHPQENSTQIDDGRISRRHAIIEEQNGQWILTDLQSANGTYVNGQRISSPIAIHIHDQIQMGDTLLRLQQTGQPNSIIAPPLAPVMPPIEPIAVNTPAVAIPYGGWKNWQKTPLVEGRIEYLERLTMKRDNVAQRGCLAVFLGLIAAPLAFLPFMQGSDINAINLRIADAHKTRMVDVKIVGDLYGSINQGDIVAIWGRPQKGLFIMQRGYNYTSDHDLVVKK